MSQRKQKYTTEQLIDELLKMDAQIIHGSDIFKQCAEQLSQLRTDFEKAVEALKKAKVSIEDCAKYFDCLDTTHKALLHDLAAVNRGLSTPSAIEIMKDKK